MADHPAEAAALDAACLLFDIPIRPEWRDEALGHLVTIAGAARFVANFPLDDEADVAPIFHP